MQRHRAPLLRFLVPMGARQLMLVTVAALVVVLQGGVACALLLVLLLGLLFQHGVLVVDKGVVSHVHMAITRPVDKLLGEQQLLLQARKELRRPLLQGVLLGVPLHPLLPEVALELVVPHVFRLPLPVLRPPLPLGVTRLLRRRHRDELQDGRVDLGVKHDEVGRMFQAGAPELPGADRATPQGVEPPPLRAV